MKLLYLHGFRSSPHSIKAQKCFEHVEALRRQGDRIEWYCPQLPFSPKAAMSMVLEHIQAWQGHQMAVIGSSLGGFYAQYVAEHKRCGAVLLNPAVNPSALFQRLLLEEEQMDAAELGTDRLTSSFIEELQAYHVPVSIPERYFLIAAKDDEVLDYQEAVKHYKGSPKLILENSDHALSDFDDYMDDVFEFIGLGK